MQFRVLGFGFRVRIRISCKMPLNPNPCVLRTCTECILGLVSVTQAPKPFILITKPRAKFKSLPDPHLVPRVCHLPPTLKRNNHLKKRDPKVCVLPHPSCTPHARETRGPLPLPLHPWPVASKSWARSGTQIPLNF